MLAPGWVTFKDHLIRAYLLPGPSTADRVGPGKVDRARRASSAEKQGHHIPRKTPSRSPSPRFAGSSTSTFQSKNTSSLTAVRESPALAAAHQLPRSRADGSKAGRVGSKASASAVQSHCW